MYKLYWRKFNSDDKNTRHKSFLTITSFSTGKAYDITYVRLKFQSPRPASFAIYKKDRRNPAEPDEYADEYW